MRERTSMDSLIVRNENLTTNHCMNPYEYTEFGFWLNGIGLNIIGGEKSCLFYISKYIFTNTSRYRNNGKYHHNNRSSSTPNAIVN